MTIDDHKCINLCEKGKEIVKELMDDSDILGSMYSIFVALDQCRKCCTFCDKIVTKNN